MGFEPSNAKLVWGLMDARDFVAAVKQLWLMGKHMKFWYARRALVGCLPGS